MDPYADPFERTAALDMTNGSYDGTIDWDQSWQEAANPIDDDANGSMAVVVDPFLEFINEKGVPDTYADVGCGGGGWHVPLPSATPTRQLWATMLPNESEAPPVASVRRDRVFYQDGWKQLVMVWSRRRVLGILGTGASLLGSGCAGLAESDGPATRTVNPRLEGTPTATATPAAVPVGRTQRVAGTAVTLSRVGTQESIVHPIDANEIGLTASAGTRYLLAAVDSETPLDPDTFTVRTADATFANRSGVPRRTSRKSINGWGVPYGTAGRTSGYLAFVVPAPLRTEAARIGTQDVAWELGPDLLAALARPEPSFELVAFDAPAEIRADEGFSIRIAVRNTGPYRATFRAVLTGARGPQFRSSTWFRLTLDPGETVEWSQAFGSEWLTPETEELVFRLKSVLGVETVTIEANNDG